jgi:hypothetical protein
MCKTVDKGGFKGAHAANGDVRFSLMTLRTYWPNWLKIMTDDDRNMCACETCQTMNDLHDAYVAKRRKIIARTEATLKEMPGRFRMDRRVKDALAKDLREYKSATFIDRVGGPNAPVHADGWDACKQYGCGTRKNIAGHEHMFVPYCCQKGDCLKCEEIGYTPPPFELEHIDMREIIQFSKFISLSRCTVPGHGGFHLEKFDEEPKLQCVWCEDMSKKYPGWKKKNNSKVVTRKTRQLFHQSFREYIGKNGDYARGMKKMFRHKQNVILLGKKMKSDPREQYVKLMDGKAIMLVRDFMEKMGISANNEMQFQYFMKSISLGGEGISVYLRRPGKDKYETRLYTVLSTEKKQDGRIVYCNTEMILKRLIEDIQKEEDAGATVVKVEIILDDTDGCSGQYRCGSALFLLWKFSKERNVVYDRAVDCAGHGKKKIDGYGGWLKNYLRGQLRGNCEYQPENVDKDKNTIVYIDMDELGNTIDFADTAAASWNSRDGGKVPANKPRKEAVYSEHNLVSTEAMVRKEGQAKFEGLKMKAKLENRKMAKHSKNNGIAAMHHFRFEKWLNKRFACCHIPCYCQWCVTKLNKLTVEERYDGPRDGCKLWPIMEIVDENGTGTGKGYNDWTFGTFVEDKDNVKAQYHASLRDMNVKIGERYSNEIEIDNYGAYMVNNPKMPVYVVQWVEEPWRAEIDGEEDVDGHTYKWNVGDYLCRAAWLEKLEDGRNWYSRDATRRQCIVHLDKVVNAKLDMRPFTNQDGDNPLPPKVSRTTARRDGAWCMSDDDYVFLLEETQLREDNCEYDIGEATTVLQMQREEQQWVNTNNDEVEEEGP